MNTLRWKEEDDSRVMTAVAALADKLLETRQPALVVLGAPFFHPAAAAAKRCARRVARVMSLRGVMAVYPETLWASLYEIGIRKWNHGRALVMPPLATKQVISIWKRWMPRLTAFASATFINKFKKLA